MRFHRVLPLVVLLVISSFQVIAQTVIRERVEIEPRKEIAAPLLSTSAGSPFVVAPNGQTVGVTVPTLEITVGSIGTNIPMPSAPTAVAGLYIELAASSGGGALKRIYNCNGTTTEINYPMPPISLTNCGYFYVRYKVTRSGTFAYCNPNDYSPTGTYLFAKAIVNGGQVIFQIRDTVVNGFQTPIPVSANIEILAGASPGYEASRLTVTPFKNELACVDSTPTTVNIFGLNNQLLSICPNGGVQVVASLSTQEPYVYLRKDSLQWDNISFISPNATPTFSVVLDTSKGVIPLGYQQVVLQVEAGGVVKDTLITLRCDYPPPGVTITYPGQDTTIVLTASNQPVIVLEEEHSPDAGQFEPTLSWDPSQTINTADYFDQIEDSLVIEVTATATNVAQMEATATRKITLKKLEGCEDATPCPPELFTPPNFVVTPQPNGFGGITICQNPDALAAFRPLTGTNSFKPFIADPCFDQERGIWRFSVVGPIEMHAVLDLCYANIANRQQHLITNINQILPVDSCLALQDIRDHVFYPIRVSRVDGYLVQEILLAHENKHKTDYLIHALAARNEFDKAIENYKPKCEDFDNAADAQAGGTATLNAFMKGFMNVASREYAILVGTSKSDPVRIAYEQTTHRTSLADYFVKNYVLELQQRYQCP